MARQQIAAFLNFGKENALSRADLVMITGLSDRELRRQIEFEKTQLEIPICSCANGGYYLPQNSTEVVENYYRERRRADSIIKGLSCYERFLNKAGVNLG